MLLTRTRFLNFLDTVKKSPFYNFQFLRQSRADNNSFAFHVLFAITSCKSSIEVKRRAYSHKNKCANNQRLKLCPTFGYTNTFHCPISPGHVA